MSKQGAITGTLSGAALGGAFGGPVGAGIGAGVGLLGGAFGFLDPDDEDQKKLIRKQEQMAREARAREEQLRRAGLQSMGQTMGAFAPRNRAMAEIFGPEAAFSGEQMADMTADPAGTLQAPYPWIQDAYDRGEHNMTYDEYNAKLNNPQNNPRGLKVDPKIQEKVRSHYDQLQDYARKRREWEATEASRRAETVAKFGTPPPGPDPLTPTRAAAATRY
jgi:hypothetical protein